MTTTREKVAAELAAAKGAAEMKRSRGESDAAEHARIGRLQGELDRLNEANEDPCYQAALRDMDQRQAQERAEEQRAVMQREDLVERKFAKDLADRYRDRLEFYRHKGTPREVFDKEIWPKLEQQFVVGEEDQVDRARREQSASVF